MTLTHAKGPTTPQIAGTLMDRIDQQREQRGDKAAYFEHDGTAYQPRSWSVYAEQIERAGRALMALGVKKGQVVAILANNRPEWSIMDLAAMSIGAMSAGIYQTSSAEEIAYILKHSGAPVIVVEDESFMAQVKGALKSAKGVKHIVMMGGAEASHKLALSWDDFMAKASAVEPEEMASRRAEIKPEDLAGLIYTSGTTGPPKAVGLSHFAVNNIAGNANDFLDMQDNDRILSYLPLSHIAEKALSIYGPVGGKQSVYYVRSMDTLLEDITLSRPTIFFGVPRVWEKMQAGLSLKFAAAEGRKAKLLHSAMETGRAYFEHERNGTKAPLGLRLKYKLYSKAVYSKVLEAIGLDKARLCTSGAAAIARETPLFFNGIGLQIANVYGLSENGGGATADLPHHPVRLGAVGKPICNFEVKIEQDGEIFLKGNSLFSEYVKNPEATAESLKDGWFATGDLGYLDEDGYLFVTGRKKDLIITSGGKNITPSNLETDMMSVPFIEHAVAVGDGYNFLSALITINVEAIRSGLGVDGDYETLAKSAAVRDAIHGAIEQVNTRHTRAANIREFRILPKPLTIEDGFLTPTMKVKRAKIIAAYQDIVDGIYGVK